ncbi:MAG TPA: alpha/beta fold hydrolase [Acidimicrobiales bacterium]|nr:alpha/beta fold hydrolase [Acidimicrobiales bacterium]
MERSTHPRHRRRRPGARTAARLAAGGAGLALALAAAVVGGAGPAGAAAAAAGPYPEGTIAQGFATELTDPDGMPPGVVNGPCTPSSAHPYPVVLVHGTFANENVSWQALAPLLADSGYCVFGFNYGATASSAGRFYGEAAVEDSARQLAGFVSRVLAWTGARQVDIVGHSQGGMMPRYYVDVLGGAPRVHTLVGLAPSNHGTTLDGLDALAAAFGDQGYAMAGATGCAACAEQQAGSPFMRALNAGGDTVPGPNYVVIESTHDEVVTPYSSAFLRGPDVMDVTLQDQCATDASEHLGIIYDPVALQDVAAALADNGPAVAPLPEPACSLVAPGVGGVTG